MAEEGNPRRKVNTTCLAGFKCGHVTYCVAMQGVILTKPIVYGNVARYFGKKREDDGHTHSWTCYLRPFKNEVIMMLCVLSVMM